MKTCKAYCRVSLRAGRKSSPKQFACTTSEKIYFATASNLCRTYYHSIFQKEEQIYYEGTFFSQRDIIFVRQRNNLIVKINHDPNNCIYVHIRRIRLSDRSTTATMTTTTTTIRYLTGKWPSAAGDFFDFHHFEASSTNWLTSGFDVARWFFHNVIS